MFQELCITLISCYQQRLLQASRGILEKNIWGTLAVISNDHIHLLRAVPWLLVAVQVDEEAQNPRPISSVKFSFDGAVMAVVLEGRIYLLDAFQGNLMGKFHTGSAVNSPAMEATFSPDSRYLLSGEQLLNYCTPCDLLA